MNRLIHPNFHVQQSQPTPRWIKRRQFLGGGMALVTAIATVGCSEGWDFGLSSASYPQKLANHLKAKGAVMYGAYWCPHCAEQKSLFGSAAASLPYVECDPQGSNPQPDLCQAKNIQGYPSWEIDGQLYTGVKSLEELAQLSQFK